MTKSEEQKAESVARAMFLALARFIEEPNEDIRREAMALLQRKLEGNGYAISAGIVGNLL